MEIYFVKDYEVKIGGSIKASVTVSANVCVMAICQQVYDRMQDTAKQSNSTFFCTKPSVCPSSVNSASFDHQQVDFIVAQTNTYAFLFFNAVNTIPMCLQTRQEIKTVKHNLLLFVLLNFHGRHVSTQSS
jgi:hypothetical protein